MNLKISPLKYVVLAARELTPVVLHILLLLLYQLNATITSKKTSVQTRRHQLSRSVVQPKHWLLLYKGQNKLLGIVDVDLAYLLPRNLLGTHFGGLLRIESYASCFNDLGSQNTISV